MEGGKEYLSSIHDGILHRKLFQEKTFPMRNTSLMANLFSYSFSKTGIMLSKVRFTLLILFCAGNGNIFEDGARFCVTKGLKYLTVTSISNTMPSMHDLKPFQATGLRLRYVKFEQALSEINFDIDTLVVLVKSTDLLIPDHFKKVLGLMQTTKIMRSVMLLTSPLDENHEIYISESLKTYLDSNAMFYIIYEKDTMTHYKVVIHVKNGSKPVMNALRLDEQGAVLPSYNLQGLHLRSSTLSWAPYFTIENCDQAGESCDTAGFLADLMDVMGRQLNFTWDSHAPPDGDWGVRPKSGPFNKSGVWGGAFGDIVNDDYMIGLSQWVWNKERYGLVDFVSINSNQVALALTPQQAELDTGLFTRPFRDDAWVCICATIILIVLVILVPYASVSYFEHTDSYMIISTTAWYFFVLVNAYYGGALTMFFSSEVSIPFKSIEDVMRSYPDWNLMMMAGDDVHFQPKAMQGDPLYAAFWDRVTTMPDQTVFENIEEGLDVLQQQRAVIHTFTGMLKGYFKANPHRSRPNLRVFAKGKPDFYALIVPWNSPLKPILQSSVTNLQEAGTMDYLLTKWEGKDIESSRKIERIVLSTGQVIIMFIIVAGAFTLSGCIFVGEVFYKHYYHRESAKPAKKSKWSKIAARLPLTLLKYQKKPFLKQNIVSKQ